MTRSVVITGAAKGIGRAIAARQASDGTQVIAIDADGDALADLVQATPTAHAVHGDVRQRDVLQHAATVAESVGDFQGWVNNAGVVRLAPLHLLDADDLDLVLDVNLRATIVGAQIAVDSYLRRNVSGSIVNISSIHARAAFPGYAVYDASKGGVNAFTRYVCVEYGHRGIRCNAVAPGAVDTQIVDGFDEESPAAARAREEASRYSPMRRISRPDEIADVVAYLLSNDASSINGHILAADNGMAARSIALATFDERDP